MILVYIYLTISFFLFIGVPLIDPQIGKLNFNNKIRTFWEKHVCETTDGDI